jgi:hypothetical protein
MSGVCLFFLKFVCWFALSCLIRASCWGERSPLGRAAALLARCPPPTTSNSDLAAVRCRSPPLVLTEAPGRAVGA